MGLEFEIMWGSGYDESDRLYQQPVRRQSDAGGLGIGTG